MITVTLQRGPNLEPIVYEHDTAAAAERRVDALCELHGNCDATVHEPFGNWTVNAEKWYSKSIGSLGQ